MVIPVSMGSYVALMKENLAFLTRMCSCFFGVRLSCDDATGEGTLACPSLCPETSVVKLTMQSAQMDIRYKCVYGDAIICDDAKVFIPPSVGMHGASKLGGEYFGFFVSFVCMSEEPHLLVL